MIEQATGAQVQNCNSSSTSPHIVSNKTKKIPRVGDIWIHHSMRSLDHFTKFFIPGIEVLFEVGDKILRVEALSLSS
jgi:hypothetical protein